MRRRETLVLYKSFNTLWRFALHSVLERDVYFLQQITVRRSLYFSMI
jgi:hypothetical protein